MTLLERLTGQILGRLNHAWIGHMNRTAYRDSVPWGVS